MAGISFHLSNMVGSKKYAVSSPRIVSLEIGDESSGSTSESAVQGIFLNDQVYRNDVENKCNSISGCDNQSEENLSHSQSSLSTSACVDRPSDKIKSTNDSDIVTDLLDFLNSADLESSAKKFSSKKATTDDKMKIITDVEASGGLLDLLSSIAPDISENDEGGSTFEDCQINNTQDCGFDLLDFDIGKNGCVDSLPCNNSSLKVEGNMSDLLSSINIDDSDVTKVGSFYSSSMCCSKVENKSKIENESIVTDLSDILSSIDLVDSHDSNKVGNGNHSNVKVLKPDVSKFGNFKSRNMCNSKVAKQSKMDNEPHVTDLSDLLSSIDLGDSNNNKKVSTSNHHSYLDVSKEPNEKYLADLYSWMDFEPQSLIDLNSRPLNSSRLNSCSKIAKDISDSPNDFISDVGSGSSSDSCASSYSEKENNSPKDVSPKNQLTYKILESDSGYSSVDSSQKGFSFFDYSSENQLSFNSLLTKKSDTSVPMPCDESIMDIRNACQELKYIVPSTLNNENSVNKDSLSMQDLIKGLNINDSCVLSGMLLECNEKQKIFDGKVSENDRSGLRRIDNLGGPLDDLSPDGLTNVIDLRECIKMAEHKCTPMSPIKQHMSVDNQNSECFSPSKVLFYQEDKSPSDSLQNATKTFEFNNVIPRKKSRVNTNQTLFSKALACKPKKDNYLLQKVANIKNELLNNIIHRPVFIDCDVPQPIVESILQSDRCVLSNIGRRCFGMDASWELQ